MAHPRTGPAVTGRGEDGRPVMQDPDFDLPEDLQRAAYADMARVVRKYREQWAAEILIASAELEEIYQVILQKRYPR